MRFSYAEAMIEPCFYCPLAQAVEDAGYTTFVVPDSIAYPEVSDSKYPYTPDGDRGFLEGKPFIEPFSLIPAMGAVTRKLRFTTFVLKLPVRSPVLVAKSVTSIGALTGNRLGLGVGTSPWPEDYRICDQAWKARGRRMDEMIEIIRGLGTGAYYEFHGEFYDIESIKMAPVPSEPVPILIGGHSDAALRRAARIGDGWMHAGGDDAELEKMIGRIHELRREYGRDEEAFEIHVISLDAFNVDGLKRLEDLGVTDTIVGFRDAYGHEPDTESLETKIQNLQIYAEHVIAKM